MPNRALRVGDVVCIKPIAAMALRREGYRNVQLHVPATIVDNWCLSTSRVVLLLGLDCGHPSGAKTTACWPSQVRLYGGAEERLWRRSEKMQAEIEAMKAERRAKRTRKAKR